MAQAALEIRDLELDYGGFKAVDGFSMEVAEGELRVLIGANGAGKTTLMDLVSGKTKATGGRVFLHGTDITNRQEHEIARAGVGRKFQIPSIFRGLTVMQNLIVAATERKNVLGNLGLSLPSARRKQVDRVLELIELGDKVHEFAGTLSHGETQWLELGMLIIQDPKIILLDEPTAGMTHAETLKTSRIVNGMKGAHTILVVEHDMSFVREIAEKITVMHLGKRLAEGTVGEIESNAAVKEAYLGSGGIH
ncbi:MAG: urea ABC transporter ATP-binding protein UrtD [Alphaproteobacteria bacterium]